MSKEVDTWMPLVIDKYLGDTTDLTTEQHGAYLLLLMSMWKRDGKLPNDETKLATIAHLSPVKWKAHRETLLAFFRADADGEWLTQKRLTRELANAKRLTKAKAEAGAKGAAKRWQKDSGSDGTANGTAIADGSRIDASIPTPIPSATSENLDGVGGTPGEPDLAAVSPTAYGLITRAIRQAGIANATPSALRFRTLVDAGATSEEFLAMVPKALAIEGDRFAYLVGAVEGERKRAARTATEIHRGPMPQAATPHRSATDRRIATLNALTGKDRSNAEPRNSPGEVVDVDARIVP